MLSQKSARCHSTVKPALACPARLNLEITGPAASGFAIVDGTKGFQARGVSVRMRLYLLLSQNLKFISLSGSGPVVQET